MSFLYNAFCFLAPLGLLQNTVSYGVGGEIQISKALWIKLLSYQFFWGLIYYHSQFTLDLVPSFP